MPEMLLGRLSNRLYAGSGTDIGGSRRTRRPLMVVSAIPCRYGAEILRFAEVLRGVGVKPGEARRTRLNDLSGS
jgi:hypothetical protein